MSLPPVCRVFETGRRTFFGMHLPLAIPQPFGRWPVRTAGDKCLEKVKKPRCWGLTRPTRATTILAGLDGLRRNAVSRHPGHVLSLAGSKGLRFARKRDGNKKFEDSEQKSLTLECNSV